MSNQIKRIKPPVYYDKDRQVITDRSGKLEIWAGISKKADDGILYHHDSIYKFIADAVNEKLTTVKP